MLGQRGYTASPYFIKFIKLIMEDNGKLKQDNLSEFLIVKWHWGGLGGIYIK